MSRRQRYRGKAVLLRVGQGRAGAKNGSRSQGMSPASAGAWSTCRGESPARTRPCADRPVTAPTPSSVGTTEASLAECLQATLIGPCTDAQGGVGA